MSSPLPTTPDGSKHAGLFDRITVSLAPKVVDDLRKLQARTRLSKTEVVNRSISLYEFFESATARGDEVWVRHRDSGEQSRIQLL